MFILVIYKMKYFILTQIFNNVDKNYTYLGWSICTGP